MNENPQESSELSAFCLVCEKKIVAKSHTSKQLRNKKIIFVRCPECNTSVRIENAEEPRKKPYTKPKKSKAQKAPRRLRGESLFVPVIPEEEPEVFVFPKEGVPGATSDTLTADDQKPPTTPEKKN